MYSIQVIAWSCYKDAVDLNVKTTTKTKEEKKGKDKERRSREDREERVFKRKD